MKDRLKICTKEQNRDKNFVPCEHCTRRDKKATDYVLCHIENKCAGGYWVKTSKKRPGKYERLLKAILRLIRVHSSGQLLTKNEDGFFFGLTKKQSAELAAIKARMEKGGAK